MIWHEQNKKFVIADNTHKLCKADLLFDWFRFDLIQTRYLPRRSAVPTVILPLQIKWEFYVLIHYNNSQCLLSWVSHYLKCSVNKGHGQHKTIKAICTNCVWCCGMQQTVVFTQRDRIIPISALTQSPAESADHCGKCEWAFWHRNKWIIRLTILKAFSPVWMVKRQKQSDRKIQRTLPTWATIVSFRTMLKITSFNS